MFSVAPHPIERSSAVSELVGELARDGAARLSAGPGVPGGRLASSEPHRILVVDDDPEFCALLQALLTDRDYAPTVCLSAEAALEALRQEDFDVVLADVRMHGMNGLELCERVAGIQPGGPVILVTAWGNLEAAVNALRAGAFDFVTKPIDGESLLVTIERAVRHHAAEQVTRIRDQLGQSAGFDGILGASAPMRRLCDLLQRVSDSEASVLITGESGTGKELVARALHRHSQRSAGRFVAINCAAMPEALLESQLFGHIRGAFTDARAARVGLLNQADSGTLFLDEIGDMPLSLQPKLLRALQERTARPLGSDTETSFDTRLIVATNRDLQREVSAGRFRMDLFFRINVIHVELPPLRARGNDVMLLAEHYVRQFAGQSGKPVGGISAAAAEKLLSYRWPGNVRELQNCIERAVALTRHDKILVDDLPAHIRHYSTWPAGAEDESETALLPIEEVERRHILRVLNAVDGNKTVAARVLGLDRKTLYRKLKQYQARELESGGG